MFLINLQAIWFLGDAPFLNLVLDQVVLHFSKGWLSKYLDKQIHPFWKDVFTKLLMLLEANIKQNLKGITVALNINDKNCFCFFTF